MSIDEAETPQDRQAYCLTPGALMVFPATGSVGYLFQERASRTIPPAPPERRQLSDRVDCLQRGVECADAKLQAGDRGKDGFWFCRPRTDYRSERLLGVAGGDLRIGQLKLQTGNPCRILASLLRRQVDELLDRDRCFLGPAKSCKPNDDIERPVARRLTLRCSHLDNRHILCPFQQRQHDGNDPSCFGDTLPGDQDAVEKTSLSGRTNSLSRLLKPVIGCFAVFSAVVSAEWE